MMRMQITALLLTSTLTGAYGQREPDSLAIIRLLNREALTWRTGDVKAHADCWKLRPYSRILASLPDGKTLDVPPVLMINPPAGMSGNGGLAVLSNVKMSVWNNTAWVSHDEISVSPEGKATHSYEMRWLEKTSGQWKLTGQSAHIFTPEKQDTNSYIHVLNIENGDIETLLSLKAHAEAPNWHPDNYLILNSRGKIYTLDVANPRLKELNTGFATDCNNDHGISPDKKWLAISHNDTAHPSPKSYKSAIYIMPVSGGTPRKITQEVSSYWHGWSPDGKTLAYCAERNGNYDVYTIPVTGGPEKRLTDTEGLDDGPDYSAEGKYIYFNSYRTGHMQIWRMQADGSAPEQLTFDEHSNWFPHPSPDNKWIVFLSYISDEKQNHLFGKKVKLRLMNTATKEIRDLTPVFFGGQGTINVPSWSADSRKLAFISYSVQ